MHASRNLNRWLLLGTLCFICEPLAAQEALPQPGNERQILLFQQPGEFRGFPRTQNRGFGSQREVTPLAPVVPPPPPLATRAPISQARLARLVTELNSEDYQLRKQATKSLKQGGSETVEHLLPIVLTGEPEASVRALSVIEAIFLCTDDDANRRAERALLDFMYGEKTSVALAAERILANYPAIRSERAIGDVREMGGIFEYSKDFFDTDDRTGELIPRISHIRIDKHWTGGSEGLKELARIDQLGQVYVIASSPVPAEVVVETLADIAPQIQVTARSGAQLGVLSNNRGGNRLPKGVMIEGVAPGKSAAAAGIRPGDVILKFGDTEVNDFTELVESLYEFEPGNEVDVVISRNTGIEREITLKVKLQGW